MQSPRLMMAICFSVTVFIVCVMAGLSLTASTATANDKYASIVIDAETGVILSESASTGRRYPASLTKIMTLLLTFEALDAGRMTLDTLMPISRHAASQPPSRLGLSTKRRLKVRDAIYGLVTQSANDASSVLAEYLAGSESNFAQRMTAKARAIGMTGTRFANAHGLFNANQYTTARDMALLARYMVLHMPKHYHYFSLRSFTYQGLTHANHNHLMKTYRGMDGLKTGYIRQSGFNLAASSVQNGRRLIGVVLGGRTTQTRNRHMAGLLDRGFGLVRDGTLAARLKNTRPDRYVLFREEVPGQPTTRLAAHAPQAPFHAGQAVDTAPEGGLDFRPPRKPAFVGNTVKNAAPVAPVSTASSDTITLERLQERVAPLAIGQDSSGDTLAVTPARPRAPARSELTPFPADPTRAGDLAGAGALGTWGIQIGAYSSRAITDRALYEATLKLKNIAPRVEPVVAPMRLPNAQWIFRARLTGLTQDQARKACALFRDCLPLSPAMF